MTEIQRETLDSITAGVALLKNTYGYNLKDIKVPLSTMEQVLNIIEDLISENIALAQRVQSAIDFIESDIDMEWETISEEEDSLYNRSIFDSY